MSEQVKAISLWQPWATLCVLGLKRYETRSWATPYRGELVIHAAKRWTEDEREMLMEFEDEFEIGAAKALWRDKRLFGAALGVVTLTAIYRTEELAPKLSPQEYAFGNYDIGRYAWRLENPRLFPEPIPYRGQQGMWTWDLPLQELRST